MRTLSLFLVSLSLVATSAIAAPPGRGERPKSEREKEGNKEQQKDQAQRDQALRVEASRISEAALWAGNNIPGFKDSPKLQLAMRNRPYTVEVVDAATKVRTPHKALSVSDLVIEILSNLKSGRLTAEKTALGKEAIAFAAHFGRLYTGADPLLKRSQDAAFRQLETLAQMTNPAFAESKPNEIKSTMEFLQVANKDATDAVTIAEVYMNGIKKTRGEDPEILKMEIEDIANCKNG